MRGFDDLRVASAAGKKGMAIRKARDDFQELQKRAGASKWSDERRQAQAKRMSEIAKKFNPKKRKDNNGHL